VFCGESRHSVDAKKRVFVPKRFQQDLPLDEDGNRVAKLTRGLDGCLYLFPEGGFERAVARMDTQAFARREHRKMQRLLFRHTTNVVLDASGRLLLPDALRELAGIEREVVMVGIGDRIEIWAAARWEAFEAKHGEEFDDLEEILYGEDEGVDA